jgi:hypothetical protein
MSTDPRFAYNRLLSLIIKKKDAITCQILLPLYRYRKKCMVIFEAIRELMKPPTSQKRCVGFHPWSKDEEK